MRPVFVSYSRKDSSIVGPVVRLLRATRDLVFHDTDSIRPGAKWKDEIVRAIRETDLFVLFWCDHSAKSEEVQFEYQLALELDKDVLPVLLDQTPLPEDIGAYEYVDFSDVLRPVHVRKHWRWKWKWEWMIPTAMVAAIALFTPLYMTLQSTEGNSAVVTRGAPTAIEENASISPIVIVGIFGTTIVIGGVLFLSRRSRVRTYHVKIAEALGSRMRDKNLPDEDQW